MPISSSLPPGSNAQLPTDFVRQTTDAKTNAINATEQALASKLDENSDGAKALKASKAIIAKHARATALANIQRQQKAFLTQIGEATEASPTFSPETLSRAEELIKQGNLTVSDDALHPFELRVQQLINQEVHGALLSEHEADIEALMDTPYRDEATRRIEALSNAPESQEECND